jgi:hypothetical protein
MELSKKQKLDVIDKTLKVLESDEFGKEYYKISGTLWYFKTTLL